MHAQPLSTIIGLIVNEMGEVYISLYWGHLQIVKVWLIGNALHVFVKHLAIVRWYTGKIVEVKFIFLSDMTFTARVKIYTPFKTLKVTTNYVTLANTQRLQSSE